MSNQSRHTGTVKFFNETKGFGFIKSDENGEEYFVHATGLREKVRLRQEDRVSFDLKEGKKGLNCIDVAKA